MRQNMVGNRKVGLWTGWLLWPLLAGGCAIEPDSEPDDDAPACPQPARTFRVDDVTSPADAMVGVDLDDDGAVDDRAGDLMRTLFQTYSLRDIEEAWHERLVARLAERTTWTIELPGCAADPVTEPTVPLGALADLGGDADDGWHDVEPLVLHVVDRGDELDAVIAGGLVEGYQETLADSILPFLNAIDTAWTDSLDHDGDGTITREELLTDPAFEIFLRPDLGTSLSFALAIHAHS